MDTPIKVTYILIKAHLPSGVICTVKLQLLLETFCIKLETLEDVFYHFLRSDIEFGEFLV